MKYLLCFCCVLCYFEVQSQSDPRLVWEPVPPVIREIKLDVGYLSQPNDSVCQSTVLLMMAHYLERGRYGQGNTTASNIQEVYAQINSDPRRPSTVHNSWSNFEWWLETQFPNLRFSRRELREQEAVTEHLLHQIDMGFPLIVSTTHARTQGHIILVVGYQLLADGTYLWIVHDPYGAFHPSLESDWYGDRRYITGSCLLDGTQTGPGQNVILPLNALQRSRPDRHTAHTYVLISAF